MVGSCGINARLCSNEGQVIAGKLEFFYDYVSPYSYLANSQVGQIGGEHLVYRPMFPGGVMQATTGYCSLGETLRYRLQSQPEISAGHTKSIASGDRRATRGLFRSDSPGAVRCFVQQLDLGDDTVLAGIVNAAGLDEVRIFERISDQAIKDELKTNTDEAIARGAFGAPTLFVGDEMFFGNDRFEFIEKAIGE